MIASAPSNLFADLLSQGAEVVAGAGDSLGVATILFSPSGNEAEIVYRRDLSLALCGALSNGPGLELISRARRRPQCHLIRTEALTGQAPALQEILTHEGIGGIALFPLLGEESVLGYVILGLPPGLNDKFLDKAGETSAWRQVSQRFESFRGEASVAMLRSLLTLYDEGTCRGVQALLVLDQEDRILFSHGVSRLIPAWGRGEVIGQGLRSLPGGRVLAGTEASGSGHLAWRVRKVPTGERDLSLSLSALSLSPSWEEGNQWRGVLVRNAREEDRSGEVGVLLELALRISQFKGGETESRGGAVSSEEPMALAMGALAAADRSVGEESIDLTGLFRGFLHRLEPELKDDRIRVLPFLSADLPAIKGDRRLIETALWAILRKAWSSLQPGGGTLTLRSWEEEGSVWCTIADDGEGIEDWSAIKNLSLEPLLDASGEEVLPDTGVEMAKELIRTGGGTFHVENRPSLWTRYAVVFPAERSTRRPGAGVVDDLPPAVEVRRAETGHLEVLVVDDDKLVRTVLRRFLERSGHQVTEAMDGEVALRILEEKDFDRVMVDIDMPGTTGLDFFHQLNSVAPDMRSRTVFMTGGFQTGETEEFIQETGRPHVLKPFDLSELSEVLQT